MSRKKHKNKINFKLFAITVILLAAISTVLILIFTDRGRGNIKLSEYVTVSFTGVNGAGRAVCSVDSKALYDELAGDEKNAVILRNIDTFAQEISASADVTEGLSNGDAVTITVSCDEKLAQKIECNVSDEEFSVEVKGLSDGNVINIFENVDVVVAGISPAAYANVINKWQDEELKNLSFTIDKATGIAIGDVLTVTCEADAGELAWLGIYAQTTSMKFTVDNVASYVSSAEQLDMNTMKTLVDKCMTAIETETEDLTFRMLYKASKDSSYLFQYNNEWAQDITLIDAKFMYKRDGHDVTQHNYVELIFKAVVSNGTSSPDVYFIFEFPDSVINADGTFEIIANDLSSKYTCSTNYNDIYGKVILSKEDSYTISQISGLND